MINFIAKVIFVLMGLFLLTQVPYFRTYTDSFKASVTEKIDNVMAEVDRIRGKVDETVVKVEETKEKITNISEKVIDTKNAVEGTLKSAKDVIDSVDNSFNKESGTGPSIPAEATNPSAFDLSASE